jgi:hypothetical protein
MSHAVQRLFALLRRAGTHELLRMDPGSAAHRSGRAKRDPERAAQHPGNAI